MLSGRQSHQILARCLVDTQFLALLSQDPDRALHGLALNADEVADFRRLAPAMAKYSGLIATVQSNGLWTHIPATRLILKRHGLDLEVFTAFRGRHQENRAAANMTHEAVTLSFFAFFEDEVLTKPSVQTTPYLADMFRHERTVWDLHRILRTDALPQGTDLPDAPTLTGSLLLVRYPFDPLALKAQLLDGVEALDATPETTVAYLRDLEGAQVRVLAVTDATGALLARIDGRTALPMLVSDMAAQYGVEPEAIQQAIGALANAGLIRLPTGAAVPA